MLELAGIHDILSKSLGTQNPINLVKATVDGLRGLRTPEEVAKLRGLSVGEVLGLGGNSADTTAAGPGADPRAAAADHREGEGEPAQGEGEPAQGEPPAAGATGSAAGDAQAAVAEPQAVAPGPAGGEEPA